MATRTTSDTARLRHIALFYRDVGEYLSATSSFLLAGLRAGEQALVAVPGRQAAALRHAVGGDVPAVTYVDMADLGGNPARILPFLAAFAGAQNGPARVIGEPVWPGRTDAEMREATRHEALINLALADADATILCPYDSSALPTPVIADACRTHPVLARGAAREPSLAYAGPHAIPAGCDLPLPPSPLTARVIEYHDDLREVRTLVTACALGAGLPPERAADLVLAVSEIAANTLAHTAAGGTVRVWRTAGEIICQVNDTGHITDPLAGRRIPDGDGSGGHGLFVVNKLCDLAEIRSGKEGTVVRLQMRLAAGV